MTADRYAGPIGPDEVNTFLRVELPQLRQAIARLDMTLRNGQKEQERQGQQINSVREFLFGDKETETPGLNKRLAVMEAKLDEVVKQRDTLLAQLALLKWGLPLLGTASIVDIVMRLLGVHT